MSYFLDIVSPAWEAIVKEKDGQYVVVLPIPQRKKYFIKYIVHPFFAQQLGLFSVGHLAEGDYKEALTLLKKRIRYISSYRFNVDNELQLLQQLFPSAAENQTYMLDLNRPYEEIRKGYARGHRRTLNKVALYPMRITESNNIHHLIQLLQSSSINQQLALTDHYYSLLRELFAVLFSYNIALIYSVVDDAEEILSSILLVFHQKKIIGLVMASTERGKAQGAATILLDHLIKNYAGHKGTFNFGGTTKASLNKYYKDFGCQPASYVQLQNHFISKLL